MQKNSQEFVSQEKKRNQQHPSLREQAITWAKSTSDMSTPSMYAPGHIILYMVIFMALAIKSYWRFWIEVKVHSLEKNGNLHINKRFNAL